MNAKLGKRKALAGPSRKIPTETKREVRQRCGFGCVVCGHPLYEYEHMEGWALMKRHLADEITLLCDFHHREKTNGLRSIASVRASNEHPFNRQAEHSTSKPYFYEVQPATMRIKVGGNYFFYDEKSPVSGMTVISISSHPILWFNLENGNLLLNLSLYDKNNNLVVSIRDNELVYSTGPWDITLVGKTLTIQAASRDTMLSLTVSPNENLISIDRAMLRYMGHQVIVGTTGFNNFSGCRFLGSGHLLNYGEPCNAAINLG